MLIYCKTCKEMRSDHDRSARYLELERCRLCKPLKPNATKPIVTQVKTSVTVSLLKRRKVS